MKLSSVGAYLRRLREEARISTQELADRVGTSNSQISRIERGEQETRSSLLALISYVLNANINDIMNLLINDFDDNEAVAIAERWINERNKVNSNVLVHPDVLKISSQMSDYELGRWVSLGEQLLKERSRPT